MRKVDWLAWGILLVMGGCALFPLFLPESLNYREASNGKQVWWQHVDAYEQGLEAGRFVAWIGLDRLLELDKRDRN